MKTSPSEKLFGLSPDQTVLVVNAHPDDLEMFHSAAIQKAQEESQANVVVAIATRGEATTLNFAQNDWPPNTPIADIRAAETEQALAEQKIKPENQAQYSLPDGKLHKTPNRLRLTLKVAQTILRHGATVVVTPGEEGVDHHIDHMNVHKAAVHAAKLVRLVGKRVTVWASGSESNHELSVPVDRERKEDLLRMHASQFSEEKLKTIDRYYAQQMQHEHYRRVL